MLPKEFIEQFILHTDKHFRKKQESIIKEIAVRFATRFVDEKEELCALQRKTVESFLLEKEDTNTYFPETQELIHEIEELFLNTTQESVFSFFAHATILQSNLFKVYKEKEMHLEPNSNPTIDSIADFIISDNDFYTWITDQWITPIIERIMKEQANQLFHKGIV